MANDITLSSATRSNLLSLQNTSSLIGTTQQRLATGLKVNSALDDALAFFKARNLNSRASDLSTIKDTITGGVVPRGADAVVMIEQTELIESALAIEGKLADHLIAQGQLHG